MEKILAKAWQFISFPKKLQLFIMRLTQDEFLIGVTGVILNDQKEILVCNHSYRDGAYWSLPGGYIKGREHPREGLAREIEEETGYIIRVTKEMHIRTDRQTARLDISLVGKLIGGEFKKNSEITEAGFFAFENLPLISQNQLLLIKEALDIKPEAKELSKKHDDPSLWKNIKRKLFIYN